MVDAEVGLSQSVGLSTSASPRYTPTGPSRSASPHSMAAGPSRSSSPCMAQSRSTSPGGPQLQRQASKRRRVSREEEVDEAILQGFRESRDRRAIREKITAEKQAAQKNPESHYGLEIAERLNKMNPRQKAIAKLRIQQVLLEVEFPSESYPQQPMPLSRPPPPPSQSSFFGPEYGQEY